MSSQKSYSTIDVKSQDSHGHEIFVSLIWSDREDAFCITDYSYVLFWEDACAVLEQQGFRVSGEEGFEVFVYYGKENKCLKN